MAKDKKPTATQKPVKKKAQQKPSAKAMKAIVKIATEEGAKSKPAIFSADNLTQWVDPNAGDIRETNFAALEPLNLRFVCTCMKTIIADLELMLEAKHVGDHDYAQSINEGVSDRYEDMLSYIQKYATLQQS